MEEKTILRTGIISDIHISKRSREDLKSLEIDIGNYASAIAQLNKLADNKLDMLIMLGDYTYTGNPLHAESFIQSTKVILDGIFGKNNHPKLLFVYGNHDTAWNFNKPISYNCINVKEWEALFKKYSLMPEKAETDGLGSYHINITKNGQEYHYITLNQQGYNPNTFSSVTLDWVDNILSFLPNNKYVFVSAHSPIQKSGVFGTNAEIECKADSLSKGNDNLHHLLSKYPNVIYLSGHTHFSQLLESSIMQKGYTALFASPVLLQTFYSLSNPYVNSLRELPYGMGLYIETNVDGSQNINRVRFDYSKLYAEITVDYDKSHNNTIKNPAFGLNGEPEYISDIYLSDCKVINQENVALFDKPFLLPPPDIDGNYLKKYTASRDIAPEFPQNSFIKVSDATYNAQDKEFSALIEFPKTATPSLHYRIAFLDDGNALLNEVWVLDELYNFTNEDIHSFNKITCEKSPSYIKITPVNEYGSFGKAIICEISA